MPAVKLSPIVAQRCTNPSDTLLSLACLAARSECGAGAGTATCSVALSPVRIAYDGGEGRPQRGRDEHPSLGQHCSRSSDSDS